MGRWVRGTTPFYRLLGGAEELDTPKLRPVASILPAIMIHTQNTKSWCVWLRLFPAWGPRARCHLSTLGMFGTWKYTQGTTDLAWIVADMTNPLIKLIPGWLRNIDANLGYLKKKKKRQFLSHPCSILFFNWKPREWFRSPIKSNLFWQNQSIQWTFQNYLESFNREKVHWEPRSWELFNYVW